MAFSLVERPDNISDRQEIILNHAPLDENALGVGDDVMQARNSGW